MCKVAHLIHHAKSSKDLTNDQIANRMASYLKKDISHDSVQKYFAGSSGVPVDNIGALLAALGFKVVDNDDQVISKRKLDALTVLAEEALKSDLED